MWCAKILFITLTHVMSPHPQIVGGAGDKFTFCPEFEIQKIDICFKVVSSSFQWLPFVDPVTGMKVTKVQILEMKD